jgi:hypothetical protein
MKFSSAASTTRSSGRAACSSSLAGPATDHFHVGLPLFLLRDDALTWRWLTYAEQQLPTDAGARIQMFAGRAELVRRDDAASLVRLHRAAERWPADDELTRTLAEFAFLVRTDDADALTEKIASTAPDAIGGLIAEGVRIRRAHFLERRGDARADVNHTGLWRLEHITDLAIDCRSNPQRDAERQPIQRRQSAPCHVFRGQRACVWR